MRRALSSFEAASCCIYLLLEKRVRLHLQHHGRAVLDATSVDHLYCSQHIVADLKPVHRVSLALSGHASTGKLE